MEGAAAAAWPALTGWEKTAGGLRRPSGVRAPPPVTEGVLEEQSEKATEPERGLGEVWGRAGHTT